MRRRIALALLLILSASSNADASPVAFGTLVDVGVNEGVVDLPVGSSLSLNLWLDPGQPFYDYGLTFVADPGLRIVSFEAAATEDIVFNLADDFLSLTGGTAESRDHLVKLGAVVLDTTLVGAQLRLNALAPIPPPAIVDQNFELVFFDIPVAVAVVVPEPATLSLWALGLLLALWVRRGATLSIDP